MAVYNTNGFTLSVGGTAVAGIIDATVTLTLETIEVTEVGAVDRKHVGGIRSASASGNIFYDQGNAQILALEAAVISGATVAVVFTLHSGATYTGTAYVTFVALDPVTRRPTPVPPLVLETDEDRAEHARALARRQDRLDRRKQRQDS